jgi:hypothetical protein
MPDDRVGITRWKDTKSIRWTRLVLSSPLAGVSTAHNIGVLADQLVDSDDAPTLVNLGYTSHFQFTSPTQSLADKFRMIDRLIHGCPSLGIQPNSWLRNIVMGKNNWRKPPLDPLWKPFSPWWVNICKNLNSSQQDEEDAWEDEDEEVGDIDEDALD